MTDHPALLDTGLLRRHRLLAGYSERGLARALGTSPGHIRRLESGRGHQRLSLGILERLAHLLDLSPAQLLGNTPPPDTPATTDPQRGLTLREARLLHDALTGSRLPTRGPDAAIARHLELTGLLHWHRSDPDRAGHHQLTPALIHELHLPYPATADQHSIQRHPQPTADRERVGR